MPITRVWLNKLQNVLRADYVNSERGPGGGGGLHVLLWSDLRESPVTGPPDRSKAEKVRIGCYHLSKKGSEGVSTHAHTHACTRTYMIAWFLKIEDKLKTNKQNG